MFLGHTRFSIFAPGKSAWKSSRQAIADEEYADYLYSKERLDFRRKMFLEVSLPILARAAEGHFVRHVVSYSSNLPSEYKDDLLGASQTYEFLILNELSPGESADQWFEIVGATVPVGAVFATYRLDDDDLVSKHYFDRLAPYVRDAFVGMILSLGRGVTAVWDGELFYRPSVIHKPLIAIGLAEVCKKLDNNKFEKPVKSGHSHMQADSGNPVVLDSRDLSFFWARSSSQDTLYRQDARLKRIAESNSELELAGLEKIQDEFPALATMVRYPDALRLLDGLRRVDEPVTFSLPKVKRAFAVEVAYRAEPGVGAESFVFSFDFRDVAGAPVAPSARVRGISRSNDPEVGFYKPARFAQGDRSLRFSVTLPDGIVCAGLRVVKRQDEAGSVTLKELNVYDL